jgi:hypothetical protein
MAFRIKATISASVILALAMAPGAAMPRSYTVRHRHAHGGKAGVLRIDENSISFEEPAKGAKHMRVWKYEDIQELILGVDTLRLVTYEDNRLELGRDRVYDFDQIPPTLTSERYPIFRTRLDARFVAALADHSIKAEWQIPVKLMHGREGSQGIVLIGIDRVVYKSSQRGESRTWRMSDLENISSSDAFDLTVTTRERDFRFQLKQALEPARYQQLWTNINQAHGLQILSVAKQ